MNQAVVIFRDKTGLKRIRRLLITIPEERIAGNSLLVIGHNAHPVGKMSAARIHMVRIRESDRKVALIWQRLENFWLGMTSLSLPPSSRPQHPELMEM